MDSGAVKTPGRRERRKLEMRERILRAAVDCFLEHGFEAATMDEIAERADVARATVFNHFQRKEAFLPAYLAQRRERLAGLIAEKLAGTTTATARLYQAFDLLADVNEAAPAETRELIGAWWRTGGSQVTDPDTGRLIADLIRQGKQRGEFRADLDPQLAGTLLLDAYVGTVLRWTATDPPPFPLRQVLHDACTTILHGLHR